MSSSPGTQVHSSQEFWEVVEILKENSTGYLVRWAGLDPETRKPWPDSWVAKEDCTKQLISEWKAKQKTKKRGRPPKHKDDVQKVAKTNSRSQSLKAVSKSGIPESHRRHSDVVSPTGVKPVVRMTKASPKVLVNKLSESEEERPKKRRKTSTERSEGSYTIKVGPPGRAKQYVTRIPISTSVPEATPVAHTEARKQAVNRSSMSRTSSRNTRSRSISVGDIEDQDNEPAPDNPVIAEPPSIKPSSPSQEIVQETQPSDSTSSQAQPPRTSPRKDVSEDNNANDTRRSPETGQVMNPVPVLTPSAFISRATSPIHSFSSSHESLSRRNKKKTVSSTNQLQGDEIEDEEYDDSQKDRNAFWIFKRQEEEETQQIPSEEGDENEHSEGTGKSDANRPSIVNPPRHASKPNASIFPKRRKSDPSTIALTAIIGRVDKVFKAAGPSTSIPDDIEENLTEPISSALPQEEPLLEDDDAIDSQNASSMDDSANAMEISSHDKIQDPDTQPPSDEDVDELSPDDAEDVDELGPDDAADAVDSSIVESQSHRGLNTSLVVNPAETQPLPPPIESPVRQLNSALGLLHRKSEEIQLLRDELAQVQEELEQALRRITLFEHKLSRAEEQREVRDLQIAGLQAELVAARSEAAVKVVQDALSSPPGPSKQEPPLDVVPKQDSEAIDLLREEVEGLKVKVVDLDHENVVLRNLYAQASNSHMNNLGELREVKRENASLREQATTGVQQANVFWQTQIATLEKKVKQTLGASELLVQQNRATEAIRERAALLPIAQEETQKVREELAEWKDRYGQLGMENTNLRIELKERDDADMARRRKEREMEEHNKRSLESHGDELVWICSWRDEEHNRCGALLDSRDSLREHCYQVGHI